MSEETCPDCKRPIGFVVRDECPDPGSAPCLRSQLSAATARASELERQVAAWEQLAEASVAIGLPRVFFWKGAKGRYLVRFAGGESVGEGSFTAAAIDLATKLGLLQPEKEGKL